MNQLRVAATLDSLTRVSDFVKASTAAAGLSRPAAYRLQLSVVELVTNTINYGYDHPHELDQIDIKADVDEQTVKIILEDRGRAFDPTQAPGPTDLHLPPEERHIGGLGVYLVLKSVDEFHYERVGDVNRSILIMKRPMSATGNS